MPRRPQQSLADIESQIEELQKKAAELRAAEVVDVVERIKVAIAHYGLTAEQLGLTVSRQSKAGRAAPVQAEPIAAARKKSRSTKVPGVAKYRADSGQTWTGNGKRPKWFLDALSSGKTPEDLLITAK